jgi:hypothetical protein
MSASDSLPFNVPATAPPPTTPQVAAGPAQWHTATVSTLAEVEQLLLRVESEGHHEHELTVLGPDVFVVRWR